MVRYGFDSAALYPNLSFICPDIYRGAETSSWRGLADRLAELIMPPG